MRDKHVVAKSATKRLMMLLESLLEYKYYLIN
jgi:hypothetical protein